MEREVAFVKLKTELETMLPPVIGLFGKDEYLKRNSIDLIKKATALSMPDLNYCKIEELDIDRLVRECETMPFLDERRLVVAEDAFSASKADLDKLIKYLSKPNPTTVLVLIFGDEKAKIDNITWVNCNMLDNKTLFSWIRVNAKKFGVKIADVAALRLVERTSGQMMRIKSELEKLCHMVGENAEISVKLIDDNVAAENEYQVFVFTDLVAKGQKQKALEMMTQMLLYEKNIFGIWSALYNHFRRMFYAKVSKMSEKQVAEYLNVKEYAIIKARVQAESFKATELKNVLDIISTTEENIKTGKLSQEIAIKTALVNILNTRG